VIVHYPSIEAKVIFQQHTLRNHLMSWLM